MTVPAKTAQFRNVLLPTDFSPCAEVAFPYALAFARRSPGVLFLAHITTPDMYGYAPEASAKSLLQQIRAHAREQMAAFTSRHDFQGVPFHTLFGEGEVWDTLQGMIEEHHIDLIVLSTHGRRGLKKLLMGSVAEEIVRLATLPVLTVGPQNRPPSEIAFRTILYPTELPLTAFAARDLACSLAAQFGGRVVGLHVAPNLPGGFKQQRRDEELKAKLGEVMSCEGTGLPTSSVDLQIRYGDPAEEILQAASDCAADLIVMSVRPADPLPRVATAFSSIAHRVISQARCPVLTVRLG